MKNAVIVFEGLPPIDKLTIEKALTEAKQLIEKYCGGEGEIFLLDNQNKESNF